MLPSTSSCLRQGPTHVTDTGRCPTPCPNPTEVAQLGQLFLCCSQSGASPSSWACSALFPALRLSCAVVCAATELLVRCSQDPSDLRTASVLRPNRRGEPVVTILVLTQDLPLSYDPFIISLNAAIAANTSSNDLDSSIPIEVIKAHLINEESRQRAAQSITTPDVALAVTTVALKPCHPLEQITCFHCGEKGHYQINCQKWKANETKGSAAAVAKEEEQAW